MPKKQVKNRLLRVTAIEHAEMQAQYLVGFLNMAQDQAEMAQVLNIFALCTKLDSLRQKAPSTPYPADGPSAELLKYLNEKDRIVKEVNEALGAFQFVPTLDLMSRHRDHRCRVDWSPVTTRRLTPEAVKRTLTARWFPITSFGAIKLILEMTEAQTLERIRKCICGTWFFAKSNKKASCGDACRFDKFVANTEDFKPGRAEYMRTYRKNPKVKAKERSAARARLEKKA